MKNTPYWIKTMLAVMVIIPSFLITSCEENEFQKLHNAASKELQEADTTIQKNANARVINPASQAGLTYDGFVNAFVVTDGNGQTYIVDGLNKRDRAYFWGQAFMITALIDGYERNPNDDRRQRVIDLTNSFLNKETYDWSWNTWTDDIAWACIAVIRAYHAVGDPTYLTVAKNNWDFAYHRGWDNSLGGGLWENMDKHTKAALANGPTIIAGIFIYEATGDEWYLDRCKEIYSWYRSNLFNPNTGVVNEAVVNDGSIQYSDNAYNTGSFINAAASLYKHTGEAHYLTDAQIAADHVVSRFPVMTQEADACMRGIAKLARENNLTAKYYPWLAAQCEAAWNSRNTGLNITNNDWSRTTGGGEQYAMQCISAVTAQMVTPEQNIAINSGTTYNIISKVSDKALDVDGASTENGGNVLIWSPTGQSNQRWIVTEVDQDIYSIISENSGLSLDVEGGSSQNGANVLQWAWQNNANQRWYLQPDGEGYFSIISVASGKALDVEAGSTDNGANIIQWTENGRSNQKWRFVQ